MLFFVNKVMCNLLIFNGFVLQGSIVICIQL